MKYNRFELDEILPHSNGMILIDGIINFEEESISAIVKLDESSKFMHSNGKVRAWVGIEYMAQTIAAWAGIHAKLEGQPVSIGFLLGSRRYSSKVSHFSAGDQLIISAIRNYQDSGMAVFDCEISLLGQSIIHAKLSVYQNHMENLK